MVIKQDIKAKQTLCRTWAKWRVLLQDPYRHYTDTGLGCARKAKTCLEVGRGWCWVVWCAWGTKNNLYSAKEEYVLYPVHWLIGNSCVTYNAEPVSLFVLSVCVFVFFCLVFFLGASCSWFYTMNNKVKWVLIMWNDTLTKAMCSRT